IYRDLHDTANRTFRRVATLTQPVGAPPRFIYSMRPLHGLRGFNGVIYFTGMACANNDPVNPGVSEIWLVGIGPDANRRSARRLDARPGGECLSHIGREHDR